MVFRNQLVSISQGGIGQRIVWVFFDSLIEILNRFLERFARALVPIETALQVKLKSLRVRGVILRQLPLVGARQFHPQFVGNVASNFALQRNKVGGAAVVLL